jgi:hypothetical protein
MTLATCRTRRERTRHARAPRSPLKPAAARCLAAPCSAACSADGADIAPAATPSSDADWCRAAQGQGFPHVNVRAQGIASHKQAGAAGGSAAHHAGPTTAARILGCAPLCPVRPGGAACGATRSPPARAPPPVAGRALTAARARARRQGAMGRGAGAVSSTAAGAIVQASSSPHRPSPPLAPAPCSLQSRRNPACACSHRAAHTALLTPRCSHREGPRRTLASPPPPRAPRAC